MADPLMRAFVQLRADDTGLRQDAQAKVKAATAGVEGKAKLSLETAQADRDRAAFQARLSAMGARAQVIRASLDVNDKAGLAKVAAFQARLASMDKRVTNIKFDDAGSVLRLESRILGAEASIDRLGKTAQSSRGGITGLVGELTGFGKAVTVADRGSSVFARGLAGLNLATGVLEPVMAGLVVTAGASMAAFTAAGVGLAAFGVATAGVISSVTNATGRLDASQMQVVASIGQAKAAWQGFISVATPGVVSVLADAVGLLPRGFQLLQPFLAPTEAALRNVIGQIRDAIAPGTQFSATMLELARASGPILQGALTSAGNILMGLLGVVRAFLPEGLQFNDWIVNSTARFREWGLTLSQHTGFQSLMAMFRSETPIATEILRNLGVIIANITSAMAGLATGANSRALLMMLLPVSTILKELSGNRVLMDIALYLLAIHSAASKLGPVIGPVATGIRAIASGDMAVKVAGLSKSMAGLASSVAAIAASPWTWLAVAAVGAAALYLAISRNRDATQQWVDMLKQSVTTQDSAGGAIAATSVAVAQMSTRIAENNRWLAANYTGWTNLDTGVGQASEAVKEHLYAQSELNTGMKDLAATQQLMGGRIGELVRQYGTQERVMALLNAAQVTGEQITSQNAATWDKARVAIAQAAAAQDSMRVSTGQLAAENNALGNSWLNTTLPALQKMTQAEDNLMAVLLSGEQAFIGYQQGLGQIGQQAQTAGGRVGGLSAASLQLSSSYYGTIIPGLQKLSSSMQEMGASTGQLTTVLATGAGEALRFAGSNDTARAMVVALINNALGPGTVSLQTLNTWVAANSTSLGGMNTIVATVTGNASKLAGVLQTNLNIMLAQAAANALGGQRAFDTFGAAILAGNTKAQDLAANGGQKVLNMLLQMSGNNVPAARRAFEDWAINGLGKSRTEADNLWATLVRQKLTDAANKAGTTKTSFENLAGSMGLSKTKADELWNSLHNLPASKNITVTVDANGYVDVNGYKISAGAYFSPHAAGGFISGGIPGRDSVPAMLMPGEVVVPASMVRAGAVNHLRGRLPGFASGGMVGTSGNLTVDFPQQAVDAITSVAVAATSDIAKAATLAFAAYVKQQVAAIKAAAAPIAGAPVNAVAALARQMAAQWGWASQWNAINALEMREAGWNMAAVNPSSGAAGIAQFINGFGEYQQYGGNSTTASGQITAFYNYIASRYGSPAAAWAHEQAYGWYDGGGWLPPGRSLAYNGTGKPERVVPPSAEESIATLAAELRAIRAQLGQLTEVAAAAPARTGQHVGAAVNSAAAGAAFRARYPAGGI